MTFALLVPAVLSLLVLAAHFLRSGQFVLVAVALLAAALVVVRRAWAARALQVVLALAAVEWVRTLLGLVADRRAEGRPFVRMAVILGAVALTAALSAAAFQSRRLRARYAG
jgi:hypothetical protein